LYGIKPGKQLKLIFDELLQFQIVNPEASYNDAETYLVSKKEEILAKGA